MIKINLHQRKAAVAVGSGVQGEGLKGLLDKLRGQGLSGGTGTEGLRSALPVVILGGLLLGGGYYYLDSEKKRMLEELDVEIGKLESQKNLLKSEIDKTSGYEQTKANLESAEKKIRTKIETIQSLLKDRTVPPKILIALSESTPKNVWLTDFVLKDKKFSIRGNATDLDVVSDFIKTLEEGTLYFRGVSLKESKQDAEKSGRNLATFELEADRQ